MDYTKLWLDYKPVSKLEGKVFSIINSEKGPIISSILDELETAITVMTGVKPVTFGIDTDYRLRLAFDLDIAPEGYKVIKDGGTFSVRSGGHKGLAYGVFELLRLLRTSELDRDFTYEKSPAMPLRMADHWDNMDGSIERGYSGNSFFFENNRIVINQRTRDYARILASVGMNAVAINNVNVRGEAPFLISGKHRKELIALAEIFSAYGIKLFLSLNFASPVRVGGLETAAPATQPL